MSAQQRLKDAKDDSGKPYRATLRQELPLLGWMVVVWGALWQDFTIGNLVFGLMIALVLVKVFRLPPIILSGRFNIWRAVVFGAAFMRDVVLASVEVVYLAIFRGPKTKSAIIAVSLRSESDLLVTFVGHVLTLVPGSYVVEVDRRSSTLYLHVLNVKNQTEVEKARASVMMIEERLIRMMGTTEEMAILKEEKLASSKERGKQS